MPRVVVGFGIVGVDFQGLLVLGHRLVHLPLLKENIAKVIVATQQFGFLASVSVQSVSSLS